MDIKDSYKYIIIKEDGTLEPTDYTLNLIMNNRELLNNINYTIHIEDINKEKAKEIIRNTKGNFFIVSENYNIKSELLSEFGDRVRFLKDNTILNFFMSSMTECIITTKDDKLLEMSAKYGGIPLYLF